MNKLVSRNSIQRFRSGKIIKALNESNTTKFSNNLNIIELTGPSGERGKYRYNPFNNTWYNTDTKVVLPKGYTTPDDYVIDGDYAIVSNLKNAQGVIKTPMKTPVLPTINNIMSKAKGLSELKPRTPLKENIETNNVENNRKSLQETPSVGLITHPSELKSNSRNNSKNNSLTNLKKLQTIETQLFLINLGYDLGKTGADGIWGKKTQAALEKYQLDLLMEKSQRKFFNLPKDLDEAMEFSKFDPYLMKKGGQILKAHKGSVINVPAINAPVIYLPKASLLGKLAKAGKSLLKKAPYVGAVLAIGEIASELGKGENNAMEELKNKRLEHIKADPNSMYNVVKSQTDKRLNDYLLRNKEKRLKLLEELNKILEERRKKRLEELKKSNIQTETTPTSTTPIKLDPSIFGDLTLEQARDELNFIKPEGWKDNMTNQEVVDTFTKYIQGQNAKLNIPLENIPRNENSTLPVTLDMNRADIRAILSHYGYNPYADFSSSLRKALRKWLAGDKNLNIDFIDLNSNLYKEWVAPYVVFKKNGGVLQPRNVIERFKNKK